MLGSWKTRKMGMLRSTELSPKYNCLFNMFSKCDHGPVKKIKEPPLFKKSQLSLSYRSGFVWHLCGEIPHLVTQDVQKNAIAVPLRMHIFFFIYPSEKLEECCRMKPFCKAAVWLRPPLSRYGPVTIFAIAMAAR